LIEVRYHTIVADPPWAVKRGPIWGSKGQATRDLPYPTMSLAAIREIPVRTLAAPDAHLYLWTINAYIDAAYSLASYWGFTPSTLLTWCKAPKGIGLGGAYTITSEHVLFARRGSLKHKTRLDTTWWRWNRQVGPHSRKPEAFLDIVESVSPGPYLEMFARRNRLGWDTWGNEALGHVEIAS
jgi:N6-adenosine-specific RNA methylase IME4